KGWYLDHHADLKAFGRAVAVANQVSQLAVDQILRGDDFRYIGDHRKHQLEIAPGRRVQKRPELEAQDCGAVEAEADRPPAHRRVLFLNGPQVGQHLVAAYVERAKGYRPSRGGFDDLLVKRLLLPHPRKGRGDHELQFRAKQAYAMRTRLCHCRKVDQKAGIELQGDLDPVPRHRRLVAQPAILCLAPGAEPHLLGVSVLDVRRRPQVDLAVLTVDDDGIAGLGETDDVLDLTDCPDTERPRDNGHVAGWSSLLQHEAADALAAVIEQFEIGR